MWCRFATIIFWLWACCVCGPIAAAEESKFTVTCSTTQIADFVRQIAGDRVTVHCVLAAGQDPHTFEVTRDSVLKVQQADLCLENGLHLEGGNWMRTLAEQEGKPIVACTDGIQPLMLDQGGVKKPVADPHAWFSPMNAAKYVGNILRALCAHDPDHRVEYSARAELYRNQLRTLHLWAKSEFSKIPPPQRVLITSHDAFHYFCRAFGFVSSAPIGWSTHDISSEVTPERRKTVVASIRESGVKAIFVETSVNPELIRDIAREAGVSIGGELYSDSMGPPGSAGETYLGMMRENVLTIVIAIGGSKPTAKPNG